MIRVTCAIIRNEENEILVVQRGENSDHPFKWEFPGGKQVAGETEEECIIREIKEELSMEIIIYGRLDNVEYNYGKKHILLIPFICDTLDELPHLSEHIAYKWQVPAGLTETDFSEADVIVAASYLKNINNEELKRDETPCYEESSFVDEDLRDMINRMISAREIEWIATSAIENQAILKKLLEYSCSGDQKLAFRSSWALTKVCDRDHEIVYPFLPSIIGLLRKLDNESAERSFLRIISMSDMTRDSKQVLWNTGRSLL